MSIDALSMQLMVGEEENYPFPEDGYHGDDIKELARGFPGQAARRRPGQARGCERRAAMAEYGLSVNIPRMKEDPPLRHRVRPVVPGV